VETSKFGKRSIFQDVNNEKLDEGIIINGMIVPLKGGFAPGRGAHASLQKKERGGVAVSIFTTGRMWEEGVTDLLLERGKEYLI